MDSVPYAKTRCFDNNSLKNEIDKISNDVIQLYNQIRNEFKVSYNFFTTDTKLDYNNRFGLVVLLEESYISKYVTSMILKNMLLQEQTY